MSGDNIISLKPFFGYRRLVKYYPLLATQMFPSFIFRTALSPSSVMPIISLKTPISFRVSKNTIFAIGVSKLLVTEKPYNLSSFRSVQKSLQQLTYFEDVHVACPDRRHRGHTNKLRRGFISGKCISIIILLKVSVYSPEVPKFPLQHNLSYSKYTNHLIVPAYRDCSQLHLSS